MNWFREVLQEKTFRHNNNYYIFITQSSYLSAQTKILYLLKNCSTSALPSPVRIHVYQRVCVCVCGWVGVCVGVGVCVCGCVGG